MKKSSFGQRIRSERLRLDYSQSAFAKLANVSQATQAAYESDSRTPDLEYLLQLADNTGLDPHFILTGKTLKQDLGNHFDWDLVQEIFVTIEYWADSKNLVVPTDKKFDLARVLYGQFSESGEIDGPTMQAALRLVA